MVAYEVNLMIDHSIQEDFAVFLDEHITEMLSLDGFEKATWMEESLNLSGAVRWTVTYWLRSQKDLDAYLNEHAKKMRRAALDRFADRFEATRRSFSIKKSYARSA